MNALKPPPVLRSARLTLRPLSLADAPDIQRLAGDFKIADTTLLVPHPYLDGLAEQWITLMNERWTRGEQVVFALTVSDTGELCGTMGLVINKPHACAELGYWIGVPYWVRGFATEAGHEVVRFAFQSLGLNRLHAHHFLRNPASGRVLHKLGMTHEGRLRQHVRRWEAFEDLECYGLLRSEWRPK